MRLSKRNRTALWIGRSDTGSALAETAVVAPLLAILLVGFVEAGRYADYAIKVANAARAGVQYGAQNVATASNSAGMVAAAQSDAGSVTGLTVNGSSFCTCADGSADPDCVASTCSSTHRVIYAKVAVSGTLQSLFGSSILPASLSSITVTDTAIMRVAE
jgi:Flp pilus assembly protein TadG